MVKRSEPSTPKRSPAAPVSAVAETPKMRGWRWGVHFKTEGRDYGKINGGHYPSNIYQHGSADAIEYDAGYEDGFNGR